jgi:hypothetical protein
MTKGVRMFWLIAGTIVVIIIKAAVYSLSDSVKDEDAVK